LGHLTVTRIAKCAERSQIWKNMFKTQLQEIVEVRAKTGADRGLDRVKNEAKKAKTKPTAAGSRGESQLEIPKGTRCAAGTRAKWQREGESLPRRREFVTLP
jgi:hypothetical protein